MNDKYLRPPGTYYDILAHPKGIDRAIEVAVVQDHRFAFYFWYKWWKETDRDLSCKEKIPPALISIDWHRDLGAPCGTEIQDLENLDLNSYKDTALFCWHKLHPHNDGHILAAAYLNLVGDVYVICKQDGDDDGEFVDRWGNTHNVKCFSTSESLFEELAMNEVDEIYFDIDLDYFTESKDSCGGGEDLTLNKEEDILSLLDSDSNLMKWIFNRMTGMTIATEPEFCGGMSNSNKIYTIVDKAFFSPQLFSKNTKWKHLL